MYNLSYSVVCRGVWLPEVYVSNRIWSNIFEYHWGIKPAKLVPLNIGIFYQSHGISIEYQFFFMDNSEYQLILGTIRWLRQQYDGIWWDMMGYDGIWWDMMGYDGIWWDMTLGGFPTLWHFTMNKGGFTPWTLDNKTGGLETMLWRYKWWIYWYCMTVQPVWPRMWFGDGIDH